MISVFNENNELLHSYTWGENGELISDTDCVNNKTYLACYDGNKNIVAYVDSTGAKVASYEYDAFGRIVSKSGPLVDDFVFRFSSCQFDKETGLIYYGYRYYNPETGRWLSRDPIGENGGKNLYGFVSNNPVSKVDFIGLYSARNVYDPDYSQFPEISSSIFSSWTFISGMGEARTLMDLFNSSFYHIKARMKTQVIISNLEEVQKLAKTDAWGVNIPNKYVDSDNSIQISCFKPDESIRKKYPKYTDCELASATISIDRLAYIAKEAQEKTIESNSDGYGSFEELVVNHEMGKGNCVQHGLTD